MTKSLPACIDPDLILPVSRSTSEVFKTGTWDHRRPEFSEKLSPCRVGCPAGNDIPNALHRASERDFDTALALFLQENPLPGVCGRVCYHPCQSDCNRSGLDGAVQIRALERSASALGTAEPDMLTDAGKGQRVAVVGSGPAGLSAAYHLSRMGHPVTLCEAGKELGGLLRTAIPAYRLPEAALDNDLSRIRPLMADIRTGVEITAAMLKAMLAEFEAVFLAVGASRSRQLPVPGAQSRGIQGGVAFLKQVRQGHQPSMKGSVLVIGGGDVAMDAAISARRLGAGKVSLACLEQEADMPASAAAIADAESEGIRLHFGWGVSHFTETGGQVTGALLSRCNSYCVEQREMRPTLDPKETREHAADHVIVAIGETIHLGSLASDIEDLPESGPLRVDPVTLATDMPGLYAGGDAVNAPGSVAEAIGAGKQAALQIHLALNPSTHSRLAEDVRLSGGPGFSIHAFFRDRPRWDPQRIVQADDIHPFCLTSQPPESIPRRENCDGFTEDIHTFNRDSAVYEAIRCFFCGTCVGCERCMLYCPDISIHPMHGEQTIYGPRDDYCKGCGTCAAACLRGVMELGDNR